MAESLAAIASVYALSYVASLAKREVQHRIFGTSKSDKASNDEQKYVLIPPLIDTTSTTHYRQYYVRSPLEMYQLHRINLFNQYYNSEDQAGQLILKLKPLLDDDSETVVGSNNELSGYSSDVIAHLWVPRKSAHQLAAVLQPPTTTLQPSAEGLYAKQPYLQSASTNVANEHNAERLATSGDTSALNIQSSSLAQIWPTAATNAQAIAADLSFHLHSLTNRSTFVDAKLSSLGYSRFMASLAYGNDSSSDAVTPSVFAYYPLQSYQSKGNAAASALLQRNARVGLRLDTKQISPVATAGATSIAAYINPIDQSTVGTWLAGTTRNVRGGVETTYNLQQQTNNTNLAVYFSPTSYLKPTTTISTSSPATTPSFELGLQLENNFQHLTASYYNHMVVRRKVHNPLEEKNIVGINNYIDVGIEMTQQLKGDASDNTVSSQSTPTVQLAASWQFNRNSMVKARVRDNTVSASYIAKSWSNPSALVALSAHYNLQTATYGYGVSCMLDNLGDALFGDTSRNYRRTIPNQRRDVTPQYKLNPDY